MLKDLILDTCVLVHANNAGVPDHEAARDFLAALLEASTVIGVDDGLTWPPSASTSRVWCEYRDSGVFTNGSLAFSAIEALLHQERVKIIEPASIRRSEIRPYAGPNLDAVFVQLAAGSLGRRLVSHDRGFNGRELRRRFNVTVVKCAECLADLSGTA